MSNNVSPVHITCDQADAVFTNGIRHFGITRHVECRISDFNGHRHIVYGVFPDFYIEYAEIRIGHFQNDIRIFRIVSDHHGITISRHTERGRLVIISRQPEKYLCIFIKIRRIDQIRLVLRKHLRCGDLIAVYHTDRLQIEIDGSALRIFRRNTQVRTHFHGKFLGHLFSRIRKETRISFIFRDVIRIDITFCRKGIDSAFCRQCHTVIRGRLNPILRTVDQPAMIVFAGIFQPKILRAVPRLTVHRISERSVIEIMTAN